MKYKFRFLLFLVVLTITSCNREPKINGLWVVKEVKLGDEVMTPNARWTRLNADFSQESGNGWFQHSYGTWSLDYETKELRIINENGINDPDGPFIVALENDVMTWSRTENGQPVKVILERAEKLPQTYGDKLLGLWKLNEAVGDGNYFSQTFENESQDYLFLRWDRRFVIGSGQTQVHGVYNVNGHKPELELIPYGNDFVRDFWRVDFGENSITLKLLNTDSIVTREFIRIHQFPGTE